MTWSSESVLVYMIADLVAASHGRTAVETPASMAAHFDSSLNALVAAKRIQTAILEFLVFRPNDSIGASVLIHPPAATAFNETMARSALRLAEPGQIILSPEVARWFHGLPGIELRAVPALTTGGTEHAGLSELIWTSAERLANLRNRTPASPTANLGALGATMIVNAPVRGAHDKASNTPARSSADEFSTSSPKPINIDGLDQGEGFEETLAELEEHQSFFTPLKIAGASLAAVLVIVALVLFHPWSGSNPPSKAHAPETPATGASLIPEPPAGGAPLPPPAAPPVEESHAKPQPPVVKPAITNKRLPTARDKEILKKPEDMPIVGFEGNSTYDGMTQKDIPRLLQWARSDAGNGNYAKAAQEYRVILQLQPSNADAREGLRKIQVAQGREQ